GRGSGNSVEYQDHRSYYLGDDIRHIDWRAYARSDRLTLKMFRREITPLVDLIVDGSLSMATSPDKRQLALALAAALHALAARRHATVRLFATGENLRRLETPGELEALEPAREFDLMASLSRSPVLGRRGFKIVVS